MLVPGAPVTLAEGAGVASGQRPNAVTLLIGPEGGLAPAETELATRAGFVGCRIGPRILRTETASLAQRRKKLPEFLASKRRPIDRAFVYSIFERDHPDCAEKRVVDAFADAILALDDSMPNGTYIDMCSKLPVVDPALITVPTLVLRGQYDGIAAFDDLIEFWKRLPNPDKQFTVMAGISHASFQQKNYLTVYHLLHAYFTQPAPAYL